MRAHVVVTALLGPLSAMFVTGCAAPDDDEALDAGVDEPVECVGGLERPVVLLSFTGFPEQFVVDSVEMEVRESAGGVFTAFDVDDASITWFVPDEAGVVALPPIGERVVVSAHYDEPGKGCCVSSAARATALDGALWIAAGSDDPLFAAGDSASRCVEPAGLDEQCCCGSRETFAVRFALDTTIDVVPGVSARTTFDGNDVVAFAGQAVDVVCDRCSADCGGFVMNAAVIRAAPL